MDRRVGEIGRRWGGRVGEMGKKGKGWKIE